jgi:Domain of unknown function (DUF4296)
LIICVLGCKKSVSDTPIEEEKLIFILSDIYIGQAYLEGQNQVLRDSIGNIYRSQIFEKYKTNKADFDTTMQILSRNPMYMEKVYVKVIENIKVTQPQNK